MAGTRSCGPIWSIFNTDRPMANGGRFAKFEVCCSLGRNRDLYGRTDGGTDGRTDKRADQMSSSILGSQIIIPTSPMGVKFEI